MRILRPGVDRHWFLGPRLGSKSLRLWHEYPEDSNGYQTHCGYAQEAGHMAEFLDNEPRHRSAERSPNPGKSTDEALGQVKSAGPFREIGNDQRRQHS